MSGSRSRQFLSVFAGFEKAASSVFWLFSFYLFAFLRMSFAHIMPAYPARRTCKRPGLRKPPFTGSRASRGLEFDVLRPNMKQKT